jgi:signal transduction histidine kinase
MFRFVRQSLLVQLLGVYMLFVAVVLGAGLAVGAVVQRLRTEVEAADLALARAIALDTDTRMRNASASLAELARLDSLRSGDLARMTSTFRAFKAARHDVDRIYWLDAAGVMRVSVPTDVRTIGTDFSEERVFLRAQSATGPFVEAGVVDLTTYNPVAIVAQPLHAADGRLLGVVATNLLLDDLSQPLRTIVDEQANQGHRLSISMLNERGVLVATPERERLLQPILDELPGADESLRGAAGQATRHGIGRRGEEGLFSSVRVPSVGWAIVVERPAADALAVVNSFSTWLAAAALLFGAGGMLFWLVLMRQVIRPLHALATRHRALPPAHMAEVAREPRLAGRLDEVGSLARSLQRLERDVSTRLVELHTLLETSNAVVGTLDPSTVVGTIIREVRRLVDVQAVAVLVPDEHGVLRVLASAGRSEYYDRTIQVAPDDTTSPSVLALRDGRPVQMIAGDQSYFPPVSYADGFRALLAIPIISHHAGGVVLLVYRIRPQPFSANEIDLLLTFANYATLAWEHAVLYERSDERLREVARENERLYRRAMEEKQRLAAIMGSMSDGLVLTSVDGAVLYANPYASLLSGLPVDELERSHVGRIHAALRDRAAQPAAYDQALAAAELGQAQAWLVEAENEQQAIALRLFDVRDEFSHRIGRGLLLRDVTRERENERFKTTLLTAVGHELRTPLAAIKGHASTLLQEDVVWPAEEQRHFLRTISAEADRLAQMVSNLLDLSRIEAGLLPIERGVCRVADLVAATLQRLGRPIPDLTIDIPADLPAVEVDGPRIEVVLRNLLANALAYGEGWVGIAAAQRRRMVVIAVSDDGPGIGREELPHLFERFYRAQRGLQRRSGGTGLGLAICKAFVEAHSGTIWAESGERGTTISFSLPVVAEQLNGFNAPQNSANLREDGRPHDVARTNL